MYLEYFALLEAPFSIAPDPRYLYMSERHREALAHLLYGLSSDGAFILLSGDVGTGKTTVSRCLLEQVPDDTQLAMVLNPKLNSQELLQVICDELGIRYADEKPSSKALVDLINGHLLKNHAQGKRTVVLIEEAQNLELDVLEQLRLLTNLETSERKLLQVILLGQPELLDILDRPELSQLAQRITARFHLSPLDEAEVSEYIGHRLAVAGCRRPLFAAGAIHQIYRYSGGVPRLINVICDRALLGCFVQNRQQVDKQTVHHAANEVLGERRALQRRSSSNKRMVAIALVASLLLLLSGLLYTFNTQLHPEQALPIADVSELDKRAQGDTAIPADSHSEEATRVAAIDWADDDLRLRSNLMAYQSLFKEWQLEYQQQQGTPCYYASTQGLSCWHDATDINGLRQMNRPVILKLYDDYGQQQYATLLSLHNGYAEIVIAGKQQSVSWKLLDFYWRGEYSMLWKNPPGYEGLISPGKEGPLIVWLSDVMNRINRTPQKHTSSYYSGELVEQVKQFQLSRGLDDDGVVGVKTIIHINQAMGDVTPRLEKNS